MTKAQIVDASGQNIATFNSIADALTQLRVWVAQVKDKMIGARIEYVEPQVFGTRYHVNANGTIVRGKA